MQNILMKSRSKIVYANTFDRWVNYTLMNVINSKTNLEGLIQERMSLLIYSEDFILEQELKCKILSILLRYLGI
jgi:hypothetical protein